MINLMRAEFRKLTSTQVWFWMLLLAVGLTTLFVIASILGNNDEQLQIHVRDIFLAPVSSYVGAFVLGILGMTTEFRYQTITPTLLATPSRWTVMAAKLLSFLLIGAAYAATCVAVTLGIAWPWLAAKNINVDFSGLNLAGALASIFAAITLFCLLGLGFGTLVRSQIVAVSVGVIWVLLAERLIFGLIPGLKHVRPYLPVGGLDAITSPHDSEGSGVHLLGTGGGLTVLLLWTLAFALAGTVISLNRDIS